MSTPALWVVLIQATPFCNIDCRYCYLPNRGVTRRMSEETLDGVGRAVFGSPIAADPLGILWHAGEPLALPPAYYRRAFAILAARNRRGIAVRHSFQTNGMLVDEEWCDLLRDDRVDVSVSVDGPAFLHDGRRVDRAGRGTFARVEQGLRLLRANGIDFSVLVTLTRDSLAQPDAIWEFLLEHGVRNAGFNVEQAKGNNRASSLDRDADFPAAVRFFTRLQELRERSRGPVRIRELDLIAEKIRHGPPGLRPVEARPLTMVSFDVNGNASTFSPELLDVGGGRFHFGSVAGGDVARMLDHPDLQAASAAIDAGIARCRAGCRDFDVCGGGSPADKLGEHGTFDATETTQCRLIVQAAAAAVRGTPQAVA